MVALLEVRDRVRVERPHTAVGVEEAVDGTCPTVEVLVDSAAIQPASERTDLGVAAAQGVPADQLVPLKLVLDFPIVDDGSLMLDERADLSGEGVAAEDKRESSGSHPGAFACASSPTAVVAKVGLRENRASPGGM